MKNIFTLAFSLLFCTSSFAQKVLLSGRVLDNETQEAIPFDNLFLQTHNKGTVAKADGRFVLVLDSLYKDTIEVSCIGYKAQHLYLPRLGETESLTIVLNPSVEALSEVEVHPLALEQRLLGCDARKPEDCQGMVAVWPYAHFIPNQQEAQGYIEKVEVYVCEEGIYQAPFRMNLYSVDLLSGAPGTPLLHEDIILHAEEGDEWLGIDLTGQHVVFPRNGFFVYIQSLPPDTAAVEAYQKEDPNIGGNAWVSAPRFGYTYASFGEVHDKSWRYYPGVNTHSGVILGWYSIWQQGVYSQMVMKESYNVNTLMVRAYLRQEKEVPSIVKEVSKKALKRWNVSVKRDLSACPQSAPIQLMGSLQRAVDSNAIAYLMAHLLHFEDEYILEKFAQVYGLQERNGQPRLTGQNQQQLSGHLKLIAQALPDIKASAVPCRYSLSVADKTYIFYKLEGLWHLDAKAVLE